MKAHTPKNPLPLVLLTGKLKWITASSTSLNPRLDLALGWLCFLLSCD
jgi:hypothetical protein